MLFQLLFLAIYDLFLRKETFFTGNRIYLLVTPILAFLIPFIKLTTLQTEYTHEISILLPEIVLSPQTVIQNSAVVNSLDPNYGVLTLWIGSAILTLVLVMKLFKLNSLIKNNPIKIYKGFKLVSIAKTRKAFSFFNYIFLGEEISEEDRQKIIHHEMVHSRQKHSADLLLFEVLKIVMWFNPLIYLFQKRIATVHEYISDSSVIKTNQKDQYINTLLNEFFEVERFSFVNQFSKKTILKKRVIMMSKEKSKQIMQAKYLLLLPMLLGMLFYISCSEDFQTFETIVVQKQAQKIYSVSKDGIKSLGNGSVSTKESYLDILFVFSEMDIPNDWQEITESDLANEEKKEYDEQLNKIADLEIKQNTSSARYDYRLYRDQDNRGVIGLIPTFNFNKITSSLKEGNKETVTEAVPFVLIDKIPTFPGCQENDKDCFNKKIQIHFATNFDKELPNTLDLSPGKKRILMTFEIGIEGDVENLKVRSPSVKLDKEIERIVDLLPQMIPGENDGKKVSVKYTLPLRIDIK